MFVPVKTKEGTPLMPTSPPVARHLIKQGKATPYWSNGVFCIRLNYETTEYTQDIVVGVDPGNKKEGFTVKSESHTYLNVQADAHNKVGKQVEKRRELRRGRRTRKCPNRKNRQNHVNKRERIPAGTRARWDWKLRVLDWLAKMFPINMVCVEDIKARTRKGSKKWNQSFSPLEVGKSWFYSEIRKLGSDSRNQVQGSMSTKHKRDILGKSSDSFNAHCVDSWVLADHVVGGNSVVDNTQFFCVSPIPIRRRQLHRQNPQKGGKRPRYGGTMCLGIAKNTIVKHIKHGLAVVCGHQKNGLSLQPIEGGKRITLSAKIQDCKILTRLNFRYRSAVSSPS